MYSEVANSKSYTILFYSILYYTILYHTTVLLPEQRYTHECVHQNSYVDHPICKFCHFALIFIHINLQFVPRAVRMEERVMLPLTLLTATVPVGTQDPTARTEVHTRM